MNEHEMEFFDSNAPELKNDVGCCKLCCPSGLSCCLCMMMPFCLSCPQVNTRHELVILSYGKYIGSLREPGCYCLNGCGTEVRDVSTAVNSTELPQLTVIDKRGNPLRVSGVVNWVVVDARKASLDVQQYTQFLKSQAEVVMKQICSLHPYEAKPGSNEDSLKTEANKIRSDIIQLLQSKVSQAGLRVIEYQFNEISYSPEIAAQMLVRQQAEAMLDARKVVVEGAVETCASMPRRLAIAIAGLELAILLEARAKIQLFASCSCTGGKLASNAICKLKSTNIELIEFGLYCIL